MSVPALAGEDGRPRPLDDGAAMTAASRSDAMVALAERLAAVEADIRAVRHRLPAAVVEEVARLFAAGATVPEIAVRTGVSPHIIRDRFLRAGVLEYLHRNRRRHVRDVLERRGAELVADYLAGESIAALAADVGVNFHTIQAHLVAEGVTLRRTDGSALKRLNARSAELIADYEAGTSMRAPAARLGLNPRPVQAFPASKGVALRHDRGWPRKRRHAGG
jgi:DNA-binding CsgD family transcriptional regulator